MLTCSLYRYYFSVFLMLLSVKAFGQLVVFDFPAVNSLVVTSSALNCSASDFEISPTGAIATNVIAGSYFPNAPYIQANTGWDKTNQTAARYFHVTITADPGYEFEITNISYNAYATPSGPSAFGFAINTTNLFETNAPDEGIVHVDELISGQSGLTSATIKIQGWDNGSRTTSGGGDFRLDDVIVSGVVTPITTNPEPTSHVTDLLCATLENDEIIVNWTDAIGGQEPDGYLIRWSDTDFVSIPVPVNGNYVSDSPNAEKVLAGTETLTINDLNPNTAYYFKIFPYSNSGLNVKYKTDGTVPATSCTTFIGPCVFETFDNSSATTPYTDGSFIGNNGITWNYVQSRNQHTFPINGKGIMLRRASDSSKVYSSTVPNGIGDFSCKLLKGFSGAGNRQVELFVNSVSIATSIAWDNTETQTFSVPGINVGGIDVVVEIRNITENQVVIDDIKWTCYDGCTPLHTIANFHPTSGPAGTIITIAGAGFTGATNVRFAGEPASHFEVVNDTIIEATVPADGLTGRIAITLAHCDRTSVNTFTVLRNNNKCGSETSNASDLFISEVYDANAGSLGYIEVFNGTGSLIDFTTTPYSIKIENSPTDIFEYPMLGSLASGATYILRVGSGSTLCPGLTVKDNKPLAPGYDGDDLISLLKNGVMIDDVPNPNTGPGFSQSRKNFVTSPTNTYAPSDWTISKTEGCENLGIPPYLPNASTITITQHPENPDCSAVVFNIEATADPSFAGANSHVWRCNAPDEADWKLVSEFNTGPEGISVAESGTPTITLTGNTAILKDYQFYVELATSGSPQCKVSSNAIKYTYASKPFYRTTGNGNWSDINIWEMGDNEIGSYEEVCQYPIERNSNYIKILTGNIVHLDVIIPVNYVEIEAGAQLSVNQGGTLTVQNGNPTGSDLIVNGTLIDNAAAGMGTTFLTGATWEIASGATIIKTNTSSVSTYRDNYETGISNIPEDANWIFRRIGENDISVSTVGMTYPNLAFENHVPDHYAPVFSQYFFSGINTPAVIKGNLDVGINGDGTYAVRSNNTNSDLILILKDLNIGANSSLSNTSTGSDFGAGFEVQGDMNITGELDLSSGTDTLGVLKLSGNQNTSGSGGSTINVNHLILEKAAGTNLSADLSFNIHEAATFTSGILILQNAGNRVEIQPDVTIIGASNTSFINGRVRKNANASANFTFPIGDSNSDGDFYQPARIFGNIKPTVIDAQYFIETHPYAGNDPQVGHCDYWRVEKVSGDSVKLALKYSNEKHLLYCNQIVEPESVFIASLNSENQWDITDSANNPPTEEIVMDVFIETGVSGGSYGDFVFHTSKAKLNVLRCNLSMGAKAQLLR